MRAQNMFWKRFGFWSVVAIFAMSGDIAGAQAKKDTKPPTAAPAAPAPSASAPAKAGKDDRVDISDIENKYWAPKDTDFSVVQNRTYTKEKRLALSLQYGPLVNDTYNEGYSAALAVNYFLSERIGVQVDYISSDYKASDIVKDFVGIGGRPNYGRMTSYYGVGFNYVPFYAKMSFMGQKILYFDMAITPTLGLANYEAFTENGAKDKTGLAYGFDVTQWFFLARNFAIRFDARMRWFQEDVLQYQSDPGIPTGTKIQDKNTDNVLILLGGTFFF
jgi:outer membrane beta-barrel protein